MIYFFYGNDFKKIRGKQKAFIKAVQEKKVGITVIEINEDNWDDYSLENLIGGQGLFKKEILIILDNLLSQDMYRENILKKIKELRESSNVFIIIETSLKPDGASIIEKQAEKSQKFLLEQKLQKPFNPFLLADALGQRDKKRLWVLYYKAIDSGSAPEEIHGILFWQIKSIILAKELGLKESELKPFVYNRAKNFSNNFSSDDLKNLSAELVGIYHQSRMEGLDLSLKLEKFILKV